MNLKKSKRVIAELIVHCTATPEGRAVTVQDIDRWHREKGWNGIGCHYVITLDGTVHEGRSVDTAGAHCVGHNNHSIGIVYVGGLAKDGKTAKDTRTEAQKRSLLILLHALRALYPRARIRGHRDFAAKACPSFDATAEYKNI